VCSVQRHPTLYSTYIWISSRSSVFCVGNNPGLYSVYGHLTDVMCSVQEKNPGKCSAYGYLTGVLCNVQENDLGCFLYMNILQESCALCRKRA
jgi:hypothetical protein